MTTSDTPPYRIVVGIDFSEPSRLALEQAATIASARGAELHPLHIVDDAPDPISGRTDIVALDRRFRDAADRGKQFIDSEMPMLTERLGPTSTQRVFFHVRAGAPAQQIVEFAASLDCDLVVVATHGLRGLARFVMGSVSEKVLRHAHCPVLVVRSKDHVRTAPQLAAEPPCPDCVQTRQTSNGAELWCERHRQSHPHAHRFSYVPTSPVNSSLRFGQ